MSASHLPPALSRVAALDPALAEELSEAFSRLARAGEAMVWAQERLAGLLAAETPSAILAFLVEESKKLTGAPGAFAVTWRGDLESGTASFQAMASAGEVFGGKVPAPGEISRTIVGRVIKERRPAWS